MPSKMVGTIEMAKVRIEWNLDEAVSGDPQRVREALRVLGVASAAGRQTATVFLMGFLVSRGLDDWEMRSEVVEALQFTKTKQCADLLFAELRRVKCSNTTRRYLGKIIDVLRFFPENIVGAEFDYLAEDTSFSPKMRRKFQLDDGGW